MKISFRIIGDVVVFDLSGKLGLGNLAPLKQAVVERFENFRFHYVLLNMKEVREVDDAAKRELKALEAFAKSKGGQLKLVNINGVEGFGATDLANFDCSYPDEAAAIRSFR
jgi:anti-anti-sigma regulatory factor